MTLNFYVFETTKLSDRFSIHIEISLTSTFEYWYVTNFLFYIFENSHCHKIIFCSFSLKLNFISSAVLVACYLSYMKQYTAVTHRVIPYKFGFLMLTQIFAGFSVISCIKKWRFFTRPWISGYIAMMRMRRFSVSSV